MEQRMKKLGKKNQPAMETVEAFYCFCIACSGSSCTSCSCGLVGNRASTYTSTNKAATSNAKMASSKA